MSFDTLRTVSAWAALTGLTLVALLAMLLGAGTAMPQHLPLLLAAVVGFELFMTGRDVLRRRRHG